MKIISDGVVARKVSIALLVLVVLVIIFMFAEHSPDAGRIRVLKEKCDRLEKQTHLLVTVKLPNTEGEMSLAADIDTLWDEFRDRHEVLLRKIPIVPEQGDLLKRICQIAKSGGIDIVSMKAGDIDVCDGFSTIQVVVDVRCRFERLGIFFRGIENMDRLVRVDRYDIRSDESRTGVVAGSLEMTGYIRPGN